MAISAWRKAKFGFWQMTEGRAIIEMQSFYLLSHLLRKLPKGDGHPVIVLPGFFASDLSTWPMRRLLKHLGYSTYGWGLGRNIVVDDSLHKKLRDLLQSVYQKEGRKVSLVGWSLGGLFAREVAKLDPGLVRDVITMGTPISGNNQHYFTANGLFTAINIEPRFLSRELSSDFSLPPPMPTTSIYSHSDGVVAWEGSVQHEVADRQTENIEVQASHFGLGVNPTVMVALADRLAQAEGDWQPFDRKGLKRLLFRNRKQSWGDTLQDVLG